jgi:hypothetical protein
VFPAGGNNWDSYDFMLFLSLLDIKSVKVTEVLFLMNGLKVGIKDQGLWIKGILPSFLVDWTVYRKGDA